MIDQTTMNQFMSQLSTELQAFVRQAGIGSTDYTSEIRAAVMKLDAIDASLGKIAVGVEAAGKAVLETETIKVLSTENAKLMAALSAQELRFRKMTMLIKDLSDPCIGCKKGTWQPHVSSCGWASANHSLEELVHGQEDDRGEDQGAG